MLNRSLIFITACVLFCFSAAFAPPGATGRLTQVRLFDNNYNADAHAVDVDTECGSAKQGTRRHALLTAFLSISTITSAAQAEVIGAGRCANGEGEGCDSLAEGNAYIQSLQRKSSENKAENQREALYSYYMRNYPDVFAVSDKRMVMKSDGSFALFSPGEVQEMVNAGRISIEYPTTMGGRVVDLTQKPVLVLKD